MVEKGLSDLNKRGWQCSTVGADKRMAKTVKVGPFVGIVHVVVADPYKDLIPSLKGQG